MSDTELKTFIDVAPKYFQYQTNAIHNSKPTFLAKIFGVYRISYKNSATGKQSKMSLLVIENLFYKRKISQKFDLKGAKKNRLVAPDSNKSGLQTQEQIVWLDENFINMAYDSPMYIRAHSKQIINFTIENDSKFLSDNLIMDYSLLVGVDEENKEFVVGIIDYVRNYTWDRKLETLIKTGVIDRTQPTIIHPDEYRQRFCEAMDQYFLCVPDKWNSFADYNL